DLYGADAGDVAEAAVGGHRASFQRWAAMASAMDAGTPRRARRVGVSIGAPVRVRCSAATLRAWLMRAAGTGTGGGSGGASMAGRSGAGGSSVGSGASSWSSMTSEAGAVLGAEWARRVPPRKA